MPVEGRALVQVNVESGKRGEIGQPGNSAKCSEAADCITCESEGRTRVSVLSSVRQGVSSGYPGLGLCPVQANDGAAGVDGQTFEDIEAYGKKGRRSVDREIADIETDGREAMAWGTGARAQEQDVPAAGGQKGPHSEAKQPEEKTTENRDDTRPGCADGDDVGAGANLRSRPATGATRVPLWRKCAGRGQSRARLDQHGRTAVVDADLRGYFDEIPHGPLMKSVARRMTDRQVLHLIKMWIEAPVEETDDRGRKHRTTRNRDEHRGIPQGSPISRREATTVTFSRISCTTGTTISPSRYSATAANVTRRTPVDRRDVPTSGRHAASGQNARHGDAGGGRRYGTDRSGICGAPEQGRAPADEHGTHQVSGQHR